MFRVIGSRVEERRVGFAEFRRGLAGVFGGVGERVGATRKGLAFQRFSTGFRV